MSVVAPTFTVGLSKDVSSCLAAVKWRVGLSHHIDVASNAISGNAESLGDDRVFEDPELIVPGHVLAIVMELAELLQLVLVSLHAQVPTIGYNVHIIVPRVVKYELSFTNQHVRPLEVVQNFKLVLIYRLH